MDGVKPEATIHLFHRRVILNLIQHFFLNPLYSSNVIRGNEIGWSGAAGKPMDAAEIGLTSRMRGGL